MRVFVIVAAVFTLTQAEKLGYNYEQKAIPVKTVASSQSVELKKDIYTYSAPENEFADVPNNFDLSKPLKKKLRVIFIKTPDNNGLTDAISSFVRKRVESKTAIYVLTKQSDISALSQQLQDLNSQNRNKPEVRFVKYRTDDDARKAQRIIQQQYESLGGKSEVHKGGVAPVLNFASNGLEGQSYSYSTQPINSYIPTERSLPKV